jgi:hypothetical protein
MDSKELAERTEAAWAYADEDEKHFVDYCEECVQTSVTAMLDIRTMQDECWRVFQEEEPYNYAIKEFWQTRATYPKPYKLVRSGVSITRKIFEMEFLSVDNKRDQAGADDWKELLMTLLGRNYGNFSVKFGDAVGMALAIGQSMEIIPYWLPGKGLRFALVEPMRIHRDPDAVSRDSQSGDYWIHQELLPYHHLKIFQKKGRYENIREEIRPGGDWSTNKDPMLTPEEIARRKSMLYVKNKYVNWVLTYEFWGTVVAPKGEMLLPNATYTVAAQKVISKPKPSIYPNLRWPGVGFSAMPHFLRFDGRGLIQGIRSLWYLMSNLMSLHADHLNWSVNPMMEIDIYSLVDQKDTDIYPGKVHQTYGSTHGQQVVRPVDFKSAVADIMAYLNFLDQRHQDGGLLDYHTMGLPGYRHEVTRGEAAQNLEQSMVLVGDMGKNVEDGALSAILAAAETIMVNMTFQELAQIMGPQFAAKYRVPVSDRYPTGLRLPAIDQGTMHVSGISGVMKDQEILQQLNNMKWMFENELFQPYLEPYNYLKAWERRAYILDEGVIISEEKAKAIAARQQEQQEKAIEHKAATEALGPEMVEAQAARHAALAKKGEAEAEANIQQAGLFEAQAGAVASPETAPEAAAGPVQ